MNILITGAGQDSSYLAEYLLSQNANVYVMTRRSCTSNHWRFAKCVDNPRFSFVDGDITDPHTIYSFLRNIDVEEIYNLAAQSHVGTSFTNPTATWMSVAQGAMNIFDAVRLVCPNTLVYQASSSEMFGNMLSYDSEDYWGECEKTIKRIDIIYNPKDEHYRTAINGIAQDISTPFHPQSPYGVAKLAAHNTARIYREAYGLKIVCGVLFNHESSRRGSKFVTRKITKHLWKMRNKLTTEKVKLGNLDICRDWGHASEYVRYMVEMVRDGRYEDRVLATGVTTSIRDFAILAINQTFGIKDADIYDFVEVDASLIRPAEVPYLRGISSWKPKITIENLVEEMVVHENGQE